MHSYNRLECVWETLRYALNSLAQVAPAWLRELAPPVWYERYARRPEGFRLNEKERLGAKRETEWQGYKVHLTETDTPDGPYLITDVQTDPAPATDKEALPEIQTKLANRELLPATQFVGAGYVTAKLLTTSQTDHQIDLLGPLVLDSSWQAKAGKGFGVESFQID